MSHALDNQTVLITGAGRGLGAAIARAFSREGALFQMMATPEGLEPSAY